jgi:hypothetical protein
VSSPESLGSFAAFKSSVYLGDILKATGYAYEAQGQGVNKDAWVENAETSAIGRALANMDYCGTLRPSHEEMSKTEVARKAEPTVHSLHDVVKDKCSEIADRLKLSGEDRKDLFNAAGQSYSNLLIMLQAREKEMETKLAHIDDALDEVFNAAVKK